MLGRRGGQPSGIDANHRSKSRSIRAQSLAAATGQCTVTLTPWRRHSMRMSGVLAVRVSGPAAKLKGTNAAMPEGEGAAAGA
jgi:hypothetical protein